MLYSFLYLYIIILFKFVFGNLRTLHGKPGELISYFINIQKIVYEFDPLVDLIVKHDVSYDALMTDFFMNSMSLVDEDLTKKIIEILNLDLESDRKLLVLLVKKFVHSLGFGFLSMRITLFLWDQLFMKLKRNRAEIFLIMAISFFCLKNEILECKNWDHLLNCYYGKAKNIDFNSFFIKYIEIFHNIMFYTSEYDLPLEKKEVLVSQTKKIDNINDSFNEINKNNEINIKEELNKKEFKPIYGSNIKKSERPEIIQPNFISKLNKNQKEINDISNLNDKEISKNIIKLDSDNKSDIGLLSDINKKQKHNIMSGFQIKK